MSRITSFLLQNWGNLASVAGLILSGLAAIFAHRASLEADKARRSVLARSMAEDMNAGIKLAAEITILIDTGKLELALSKCNDLLDLPNQIRSRWESELAIESRNRWLAAYEQLDSMHKVLSKSAHTDIGEKELNALRRSCTRVRTIFAEEYGSAQRLLDRGSK
jgi:hypothetical protein